MRQKAIPKDRRLNHDRDERKRNRKVILRLKPSTPKTSIHFISLFFLSLLQPEETLDLLAAGAAKTEMPILTPVYEAMNASLQEVVPKVRKSGRKCLFSVRKYVIGV